MMSDLIRRADAIEAVENNSYGMGSRASVKAIKALPSAETSQNLAKPIKALKGSDLISRDVVLVNIDERLRANGYGNVGLVSEFNRLIGYVRNIPSADAVQGWVPCSERLPEKNGWYLITIRGYETVTDVSLYSADGSAWGDVSTKQKVIAWMPLPDPYKGGSDDKGRSH